jgi:Domain of unknown function (DUF4438), N-terminal/Domain of unknown function (DUF4438), C-terminal
LTAPRTNADRLVEIGVQAEVAHPTHSGTYAVDSYGRPIILPGMAGVVANARVGDLVFPWAADHLEPGVSAGNPQRDRYQALQFLACIGNVVRVLTGPAAGAEGRVTGKHAFVLVDFPQDALDVLAPGDGLLVRAVGQGLRFLDFEDVAARSCSPALVDGMGIEVTDERLLRIAVAAEVPAFMMGAGLGMSSEWANCDVMFTRREVIERLGFERVRLGDVVAMHDQDHRYGRGLRAGMLAIGVVAHGGHGGIPGHGMGVATILSGPREQFELMQSEDANLRNHLSLAT